MANHAIGRAHEGGEVPALVLTGLEVLLLLGPFMLIQDFLRWVGAVRRCIGVHDADIQDAVGPTGPEATDEEIASVVILLLSLGGFACGTGGGGRGWGSCVPPGATNMD